MLSALSLPQKERRPSFPGRWKGWEAPFSRRISRRCSTWVGEGGRKPFERKRLHSGKSCGDDNRFRSVCAHSVECHYLLGEDAMGFQLRNWQC